VIYAGKIVPKSMLTKPHQRDKVKAADITTRPSPLLHLASHLSPQMAMEIEIHKSLNHKHIVKFHGFFEDKENIYILLELCRRRVSTHTSPSLPCLST